MYSPEQITILEMLLELIKEHEQNLEAIVTRLENKVTLKQYLETPPNK